MRGCVKINEYVFAKEEQLTQSFRVRRLRHYF
jgi:hypothetical protein